MDMKIVRSLADHLVKNGHGAAELERYMVTMATAPSYAIAAAIDKGITLEEMRYAFRLAIDTVRNGS